MQHQTSDIKKIMLFLIIFATTLNSSTGQNLVPNPSFEEYTTCPDNYYMLPTHWYTCSGDPDYYNACDTTDSFGVPNNGFGCQFAATGNAYCGYGGISFQSIPYYKEYLGAQLLSQLLVGEKYFISFKICSAEMPEIKSNNNGILFSTKKFIDDEPYDDIWNIPTTNFSHLVDTNIISDTLNWKTISGNFIADSAYYYILVGNFFDSISTKYEKFGINPFQQHSYYYIDDICVSPDSEECNLTVKNKIRDNLNDIIISPNPASEYIKIFFNIPETISIYYEMIDMRSVSVFSGKINERENIINVSNLKNGLYVLKVITSTLTIYKKIIINH